MLELSLDQQQEAGLFLRAQRRPAPPWFILLLLRLLQMVEYSEIDGVDSIIIKVSLAEFVNVIDYSPRLAPGTQGILRPACCGAVLSVSKSKCECFLSLVSHTAQQGGGAPGMSPGHSSWGPQRGCPIRVARTTLFPLRSAESLQRGRPSETSGLDLASAWSRNSQHW